MYDEICMVGGKSRPIRRSALGGGVEAWAFVDADSSFSGPRLRHPLRHPHRRVRCADVQADGQGRGTVGFMLDPF